MSVGFVVMFSGMFYKPHWLRDCGGLIILMSLWTSLYSIRVATRVLAPTMERLRQVCDFYGVPFGFGNALYRRLFPIMLTTLVLAIGFLLASMIFATGQSLLRYVSDAFQLLWSLGMVISMTRDRNVERALRKLDLVVKSGISVTSPPIAAKFILLLVPKRNREHLIGDLEEEHKMVLLPEYGVRKARTWYWWQVAISIGPLMWAQLKRGAVIVWLWRRLH